jgi:hypothetical protein
MSGQSAGKRSYNEINNQKQGKSGAKVKRNPGPAKGKRGHVNPTKGGGIFRKTK